MPIQKTGITDGAGTISIQRYEYDILKRRYTLLDVIFSYCGKESWKIEDAVASAKRVLFGTDGEEDVSC